MPPATPLDYLLIAGLPVCTILAAVAWEVTQRQRFAVALLAALAPFLALLAYWWYAAQQAA